MGSEQKILDDETAKRLAEGLRRAQQALADAELGTLDRIEAHRRLREIFDEIASYFN